MLKYVDIIKVKNHITQISYLDYVTTENAETKSNYIREKREMQLDSIINDAEYDESILPVNVEDPFDSVSMFTKNVKLNNNVGIDKWSTWVKELEIIAQIEIIAAVNSGFNIFHYNTSTEPDPSINLRRCLSRIISATSYIAVHGRRGPGNICFVGYNAYSKFQFDMLPGFFVSKNSTTHSGTIAGIEFILCKEIAPDSVLVFRKSDYAANREPVLALVEHESNPDMWAIAQI